MAKRKQKSKGIWIALGENEVMATLYIRKPEKHICEQNDSVTYFGQDLDYDLVMNSKMGLKPGECRKVKLLF